MHDIIVEVWVLACSIILKIGQFYLQSWIFQIPCTGVEYFKLHSIYLGGNQGWTNANNTSTKSTFVWSGVFISNFLFHESDKFMLKTHIHLHWNTHILHWKHVCSKKNPSQISKNPPPNQLDSIFWLIITTLSPPTKRRCLQQLFGLKFFHGLTPQKRTKYLVHWLAQIFIYIQENTQAL